MTEIGPHAFALEVFPDGGVLLDLEAGMLLRLNRSSTFVWERILAGIDQAEIADAFSAAFGVDMSLATRDVAAALKMPERGELPVAIAPLDFRYELVGERYRVSLRGAPALEISASGDAIRWLDGITQADLAMALSAVSPKLIALRGTSVLHASAVSRPDGSVTAFLGESGAGKTTTARAFARTGWRLVCEDKLILRAQEGRAGPDHDGAGMSAILGAEARITAWLGDARARLQTAGPGTWCDAEIPIDATTDARGRVTEIVLVNRTRRAGGTIALEQLGATAATAEIFMNGFYGSSASAEWRRALNATATLARTARTYRATMPDGLEALAAAARSYTAITAS